MAIDAWFSDLYERNYVLLYRVGRVFLGYDPVQEPLIEDSCAASLDEGNG